MIQLSIESFLIESLISNRVRVKVRRMVRRVHSFFCPGQLTIQFPSHPAGEKYRQLNRATGKWEWKEREWITKEVKTGKVGSPVKMRKIIKDDPYLQSI